MACCQRPSFAELAYQSAAAGLKIIHSLKKEPVIKEKNNPETTRRKPWVSAAVFLFVLLFLAVILLNMPKGFKTTHEQLGAGKPALVFVYDPNLAVSVSQPEQMNVVREQLGDQVVFLFAQIATPQGNQLIAEHGASPGELLLFDSSGVLVKRQFALISSGEIIQWLAVGSP